jgi:ketol-acid reductoisomerase
MGTIYHDEDADLAALSGHTIAVVGYGNQGRAQALNLRDSGLPVVVGSIRDAGHARAADDGFEVAPIPEAVARARVVMLLVPDEVMPEVYRDSVAGGLRPGDLLSFASGYNIAFDLIRPPPDVDVVLLAPRMIGVGVREAYVQGRGFPSFVGVHQDASGSALARLLALAKGVGSTRAGCIEMSMHDEASLDLFNEQGFGPAFGRVLLTAADLLVEAGYPPEAVLLELYLSGELAYSLEQMRRVGMGKQMDYHSRTSQYGSATRGARFLDLDGPIRDKMRDILEEIRSGRFAAEWTRNQAESGALLDRIRQARDSLPVARWDARARAAFRIGEAGE